ncbi:MAG: bifunctional oligoribonuclease/PAP phosphatase NrnA [Verrucomicrobiales bacterium]|nr:bifunctional oligoribonuclease/PAP phosphatase NrnA [Verrucomicrobiales bacterium]
MNAILARIQERIDAAASILVLSHDRPDGDAIGSAVAMGLLLEAQGKLVRIVNFDDVPESLRFLPGSEKVTRPTGSSDADLVFVLDSAGKDRIHPTVWEMISPSATLINIDHHISNSGYGDLAYIDVDAPATGQLVYELAVFCDWTMNAVIGENLLAAISTDTGSFRYPSTSPRTFFIAGEIAALGVDIGRVNRMLYENYPARRVEALTRLLQGMRTACEGRYVSVHLPLTLSEELNLQVGDTEGVIDVIRAIDTVLISAFFEELPDGKIRVSSRSKDERFSVGTLCARFGGGGHTLAAGARLSGPLESAEARFLAEVETLFL